MPLYISLVYATPIEFRLLRREILLSQAAFSHRDANVLGQPILYREGRTTLAFNWNSTLPRSARTPTPARLEVGVA
jgi:hypothetical protein